jgi:hypothetical protein
MFVYGYENSRDEPGQSPGQLWGITKASQPVDMMACVAETVAVVALIGLIAALLRKGKKVKRQPGVSRPLKSDAKNDSWWFPG